MEPVITLCRIYTVQDPTLLVVERTEGCEGWKIQPDPGPWSTQQALRRPGEAEENSNPQKAGPLWGSLCLRPACQDHQEEINM